MRVQDPERAAHGRRSRFGRPIVIAALVVPVIATSAGAAWWFGAPGPWSRIDAPTAGTAGGPLDIDKWRGSEPGGSPQLIGSPGNTARYLTLVANDGSAALEIDRVGLDERVVAAQWAP